MSAEKSCRVVDAWDCLKMREEGKKLVICKIWLDIPQNVQAVSILTKLALAFAENEEIRQVYCYAYKVLMKQHFKLSDEKIEDEMIDIDLIDHSNMSLANKHLLTWSLKEMDKKRYETDMSNKKVLSQKMISFEGHGYYRHYYSKARVIINAKWEAGYHEQYWELWKDVQFS